jgi:hypothetical protein
VRKTHESDIQSCINARCKTSNKNIEDIEVNFITVRYFLRIHVYGTLPLSCVNCLEIWEPQPPGMSRPVMGLLYLFMCLW